MTHRPNYRVKFAVAGDTGVGKTSILRQFIDRECPPVHDMTIGVEYNSKIIELRGTGTKVTAKIQFWDTSGQAAFHDICKNYYIDVAAVFIVYDVTRKHTFEHVTHFYDLVRSMNPDCKIVLVGHKADLTQFRQVSTVSGSLAAEQLQASFYETRAKTDPNVDRMFEDTVRACIQSQMTSDYDATCIESPGTEKTRRCHACSIL